MEVHSGAINNGEVMCLKWMDKWMVSMLSTFHTDDMMVKWRRMKRFDTGFEEITKPVMIEEYNKYMSGVGTVL